MKLNKIVLLGAALTTGAMSLTSCDDDKIFDMNHPEATLISTINFDYEDELTLPVGMDLPLKVTIAPQEAASIGIIYKSTDENVAYIDENSVLHCIAPGICNVSAVPEIGFGATAKLTVNVADHVIYAESLTIELDGDAPDYMYAGDTFQLKAIIGPEDHTYNYVNWSSSNPAIVSVDNNGQITCNTTGEAKIYAETRFPDKEGVKGEYTVSVSDPVDVDHLDIAAVTEAICVSRPFDLEVTYYPAYGTKGSVEWSSSDESVAVVTRGRVTPVGFGDCIITAKCPSSGFETSLNITVTPGWYIWDVQNKWSPWTAGSNAKFTYQENTLKVTMSEMSSGGDWRGDIMLVNDANNPARFHFGEYPVIALRTTIPANGRNTFDGVSADDVNAGNPQCNEGRFATGEPITLADGTKLIYVDFAKRTSYSTTGYTDMKLLQLKVADIPAADVPADKSYVIYWIRTFRSIEEMKAFAEAEVAAGK